MKKTIITSIILFAVVLAYVALRSPAEKTATANLAVASAEDWANVNAIAAQYAPELKALEAKRNRILEDPNSTISSIAPEARAARLERDLANKAIRDKERELWEELSPYLSPYELREYKLKHSQMARDLWEESAWFEPSKADFLALYTYREKRSDMLDAKHGGDTWREGEAIRSASDRQMQTLRNILLSDKSGEERLRAEGEIWEMKGEDMDYLRAFSRVQRSLREMMGSDRVDKFFAGPNAAIKKAYSDGMNQANELWARGEITDDEFVARHQRLDEEYKATLNSADSPTVPEDLE